MTARELYEYALIEINKTEAHSLLLEDYNYFMNKAIQQYVNEVYNKYDINQQSTDDMRTLKETAVLDLTLDTTSNINKFVNNIYYADLPPNYLHMLNCLVQYDIKKSFKCYDQSNQIVFGARRLTADMFSQIINNAYMRPDYKRPYYFINNVMSNIKKFDTSNCYVDYTANIVKSTDLTLNNNNLTGKIVVTNAITYTSGQVITINFANSFARCIAVPDTNNTYQGELSGSLNGSVKITVSSTTLNITGVITKHSLSRIEVRYGKDNKTFEAKSVYIDYIRTPRFVRLTQDQIDTTEDTSDELEFQDYVCYEIVNKFVKILLENASDPRIQTNPVINQTIPTGYEQQQQAQ